MPLSYPTSGRLATVIPHWSGTTSGTLTESNRFPESGFRQMAVVFGEKCPFSLAFIVAYARRKANGMFD